MQYTRMNELGPGLEEGINLMEAIRALYEIEHTAMLCGVCRIGELLELLQELVNQDGRQRVRRLIRSYEEKQDRALERREAQRRNVCGRCRHFRPHKVGAHTGVCMARPQRNRKGDVVGEHCPVNYTRRRCQDDFEEKDPQREIDL